jgi:glutathione S-transferase
MTKPKLYAHPFSSYCQKASTAFYEKGVEYELAMLSPDHPDNGAEFGGLWPLGRFPIVVADGRMLAEASIIVEYVDSLGAPALIPADRDAALDVRMLDRVFDNYVMAPMQAIVADTMRPEGKHDPFAVEQAHALLDRSYAWLDGALAGREWAAGDTFTLADCAAAPSLLYADWVHPIVDRPNLAAYRARLLARPSYARALDEARPYRPLFPLGDPGRD